MGAVERALGQLNTRSVDRMNVFTHLDGVYDQIYTMLENTFKFRDGKSCIVVGPRGVGKTSLVEVALRNLETVEGHEFFCIRLNGSYFKDDALAIKEIARQLDWYLTKYNRDGREELRNATFEQKSVTGTMNVIMSILDRSRLSEENSNVGDENEGKLKVFIPIVFLIDEIDKYTNNAKQTLLYNLFDMASSKTGGRFNSTTISVIGISTRTTVREQLEKRVKSRFSQRMIQINKVKDLEQFMQCVYEMVKLDVENCGNDIEKVENETFNIKIKEVIETGPMRKRIVENFYTIKDLNGMRNELVVFLSTETLSYQHLADYSNRNKQLMKSLSETERQMLICCCRVKIKNSVDVVNYDMVFREYHDMTLHQKQELQSRIETAGLSLGRGQEDYTLSRAALQVCWERLMSLGLLQVIGGSGQTQSCSVGVLLDDINQETTTIE